VSASRRASQRCAPALACIAQEAAHRIAVIRSSRCVDPIRPKRRHRGWRCEKRSMLGELERPKKIIRNFRDFVAERRCTKAGMKLYRLAATAGLGVALTDDRSKTGAREDHSCGQSLHARANDCGVVRFHLARSRLPRPTRIIGDAPFARG
jgi:hypothetical protein